MPTTDEWTRFIVDRIREDEIRGGRELECAAYREILNLHENWVIMLQGPAPESVKIGDHVQPGSNDWIATISSQAAFLTLKHYREQFGDSAPSTPIIEALGRVWKDHPDYPGVDGVTTKKPLTYEALAETMYQVYQPNPSPARWLEAAPPWRHSYLSRARAILDRTTMPYQMGLVEAVAADWYNSTPNSVLWPNAPDYWRQAALDVGARVATKALQDHVLARGLR